MKPIPFKSDTTPWRVRVAARYSETGKVQIKYFRTRSACLDFIAKLKVSLQTFGEAAVTIEERTAINHARQMLGTTTLEPRLLADIIAHWLKTGEGAIHKKTVFECAEEYIAWTEGQTQRYSRRTLSDIRYRIKAFANHCADDKMHELGAKEISGFLDLQTEGWQRKSFFKRLRPFFGFAKEQRIIAINPMKDLASPHVSYFAPEIYEPDDVLEILEYCELSGAEEMLPFVICSAFGFIRTAELIRMYKGEKVLQWQDILWSENLIRVPHDVAKRTKRQAGDERFIPLNETFRHWMYPIRKDVGPVVNIQHNAFYKRMRDILDASGVAGIDNGLRHSCLSYFIAANPDVGIVKAAQYAGNSEATTKRHYLRMLKPADAAKYWELRRNGSPGLAEPAASSG